MRKLLFVVNVDWFFLSHRKDIAIAAKERGWEVTVVTADTGRLSEINSLGLRVINLPMSRSGMNPLEELKTLRFLRRLYKKEKPDVVHHVGMKTILWGTIAAKQTRVHGVVNAISGLGGLFSPERKGIVSKMVIRLLRYSHSVPNLLCIFQNSEDWNLYVDNGIISKTQGRYIKGSGIDLSEYHYCQEPLGYPIRVILTARMIVEKGIFILIEAAEKLRCSYEGKVEFLLVGGIDDHPGAITKEQLDEVCDGIYIKWLGYRSDVKELLMSSHIVAFPSYYMEGLPKSLIEADAIGRPVITSDSVGCKEAVINGKTGYLIPPKDADALVDRLKALIDNKDLREKMGRAARAYAEANFSIKDVIDKHLAIYQELIEAK